MTPEPATTGGASPQFYRLPGVKLFASGRYRGKRWTAADVRQMERNAKSLGPSGANLLLPPAAPGHEDDDGWQKFVGDVSAPGNDRTDEPAAGWVDPSTVRAVPDPRHRGELILTGDVVNVPAAMADDIRAGRYRFGSAEIYDDFLDDFGKGHGKTLRKFSYLGNEVPQVKRLGPLPAPVPMPAPVRFAEPRPGVFVRVRAVRSGSAVHTYAETTVMDRSQMIAAIQAAMPSLSQTFLDGLADDRLAELVAALPSAPAAAPAMGTAAQPAVPGPVGMMAEGEEEAPAGGADAAPTREEMIAALVDAGEDAAEMEALADDELEAEYEALMEEGADEEPGAEEMADEVPAAAPAGPTREEMIAELAAAGQDPAALEALTDEELLALYEQAAGAAPAAPAPPAPATTMGERTMTRTPRRPAAPAALTALAEKAVRRTIATSNKLTRLSEQQYRRVRKAAAEMQAREIDQFCDQLVREGRFTPAQVKAVVRPLLAKSEYSAPRHTFSEGKVTRRVTEFELRKIELSRMPKVVHFGERLGGDGPATTDAAEEAKVREFAATLSDGALAAAGLRSREQFVQKFSECRKKRPDLTAKQYLGT